MATIGFLGSGNMAEALIKGIIKAKLYQPDNIFISDIRAERIEYMEKEYEVVGLDSNKTLASKVDILVLSIKPQQMEDALISIKAVIAPNVLVISIAAGIKVEKIQTSLGKLPIVRVMPNTPALIGEGASALYANEKAKPRIEEAVKIFSAVGNAVVVDEQDLIDAVTALSGSGPAYYFLLMEEMIKAAVKLGLDEPLAKQLVLQTAKGAAILALEADKKQESPQQLRKKVTSPGGTTEAAIKTFTEGKFADLVTDAIQSAANRSRELSG